MVQPAIGEASTFRGWPVCDDCGLSVAEADGGFAVDYAAMHEAEAIQREWDQGHDEGFAIDLAVVPLFRDVPWDWGHSTCFPGRNEYWIAADRINTIGKALHWTLHLSSHRWFKYTAWEAAVRRLYNVPHS